MSVILRPISEAAAAALIAGRPPGDVVVAPDHPTEFSAGIAPGVRRGSPLGPFFIHRAADDEHEGEKLRVRRWELALTNGAARAGARPA